MVTASFILEISQSCLPTGSSFHLCTAKEKKLSLFLHPPRRKYSAPSYEILLGSIFRFFYLSITKVHVLMHDGSAGDALVSWQGIP